MIEDVKNFGIRVTAEEKAIRSALCDACEERIDSTCSQCACPIEYVTEYKYKKCPLDKWSIE
jgi:hypothetical protein